MPSEGTMPAENACYKVDIFARAARRFIRRVVCRQHMRLCARTEYCAQRAARREVDAPARAKHARVEKKAMSDSRDPTCCATIMHASPDHHRAAYSRSERVLLPYPRLLMKRAAYEAPPAGKARPSPSHPPGDTPRSAIPRGVQIPRDTTCPPIFTESARG